MTTNIQPLPGAFPLHENRDFLRESEWVILKLLCRPLESLADEEPEALSAASGGQLSVTRCRQLIDIVRISRLSGLGSWMARLMVEAGLSESDVLESPAEELTGKVNEHMGYAVCNAATARALGELQLRWRGETCREQA